MKQYIILVICIIFFISLVSADIRLTLNTPQVTFRNIIGSEFNYHIEVKNNNNFIVDVIIIPPEDLDIQFEGPLTFSLYVNQSKDVSYHGIINKTGNYSKNILVKFIGNNDSFSLASTLMFIVPEINNAISPININTNPQEDSDSGSYPSINNTNSTDNTITNITINNTAEVQSNINNTTPPNIKNSNWIKYFLLLFVIIIVIVIILFIRHFISEKNEEIEVIKDKT